MYFICSVLGSSGRFFANHCVQFYLLLLILLINSICPWVGKRLDKACCLGQTLPGILFKEKNDAKSYGIAFAINRFSGQLTSTNKPTIRHNRPDRRIKTTTTTTQHTHQIRLGNTPDPKRASSSRDFRWPMASKRMAYCLRP